MKRILFVLLASVVSSGIFAQDVKAVATKYYNLIGGKSAESNIKTYVSKISTSVMGQFMDITQSVIVGESAKLAMNVSGMEIIQVWNKDHGWMTDPMTGSIVDLEKAQAGQLIDLTDLFSNFNPDKLIDSSTYLGKKDFDGESLEGIKLIKDGNEVYYYFDSKGFLKISQTNSEMGDVTVKYSDYRDLDFGYKIPYKIVTSTPMFEVDMVVSEFKINEKIDPAIFVKP